MPPNYPFYIVDVFAESRYAGNQLAVFRAKPSAKEMQQIAQEMRYSETTFITTEQTHHGGYDVRIFTTTKELPFAGHPTLGTAYILRREIIRQPVSQVVLNLKVGQIPVTFGEDDVLWMQQNPPQFANTYLVTETAEALGLEVSDFDARFPIQAVSTGLPAVIVPLRTRDAVKRARVNVGRFQALTLGASPFQIDAILCFCPEPYHRDNHLNVRVLFPEEGATEDAATGSANGCLAAYLAQHRYFGSAPLNVQVEQGYEIGRPSLLRLRASIAGASFDVQVGGKVVMIAKGEFTE